MNFKNTLLAAAVSLLTVTATAWAQSPAAAKSPTPSVVDIGGNKVPVTAGGLYDRFRSNPPLSVVAAESPNTDLSWFKTLTKTRRDIGFESYSPNFYYDNSLIQVVFTADIDKLRELMPAKVREQVQPLQVLPGRGLVALTAYAYHYCDNDSYNEIALSVITNQPGKSNWGPLSLVGQASAGEFWGYVYKLPVNTELAKVRGVVGYNLPKWNTRIDYRQSEGKVFFEIADQATGKSDFVIEAAKLKDLNNKVSLVKNSFTNIDRTDRLTTGYSVSRKLSYASSFNGDNVNLKLSDGSFSTFIKSLQLGRMVQYQYVPSFQMALYAPEVLATSAGK